MRPDPADPAFQQFLKEIDDHFIHVVGDLLGWTVLGTPEFTVGSGNVVIRFATVMGERYLFRVPRFSQDQLRRVALAYRHFEASGLMPAQVYLDGKCVLERFCEGLPLSRRTSDAALQALGRALALVHAVPGEGYGPLSHGVAGLHGDARAYYAQSADSAGQVHDEEAQGSDRLALEELARRAARVPDAVHRAQVRLGHGDLWRNNIVVDAGDGISLIDWDRIGCYPREYDFVCLVDADLDARQKDLVLAGYGMPLDPVLRDWFALRRLMGNRAATGQDTLAAAARHGLLG